MQSENEAYAAMLCSHIGALAHGLRQLPADKWDWTPDVAAPTPRILATHAWQWLICDRQHIAEPDASKHPRIPEPPTDPQAMCDALVEEGKTWRELIMSLTPEQLNEPRHQFNSEHDLNVRWFLFHIIQNTIYKNGQFYTLYYALGLDGAEPYSAPFPNPIYEQLFGPTPEG
jgi:hypothetical protein